MKARDNELSPDDVLDGTFTMTNIGIFESLTGTGTHQLVSDAIQYKNLGLLIVDEEQKFGVNVKEKIRSIKENIDVLTLMEISQLIFK